MTRFEIQDFYSPKRNIKKIQIGYSTGDIRVIIELYLQEYSSVEFLIKTLVTKGLTICVLVLVIMTTSTESYLHDS